MQHGNTQRTMMTSLARARQVLADTSELADLKRSHNRRFRRRSKQLLAKTADFDDVDFGMTASEFDTAWEAF